MVYKTNQVEQSKRKRNNKVVRSATPALTLLVQPVQCLSTTTLGILVGDTVINAFPKSQEDRHELVFEWKNYNNSHHFHIAVSLALFLNV